MSNDPNEPFFELTYARSLSRSLRSTDPASRQATAPTEAPRFSRFSRSARAGARSSFDADALVESLRNLRDAWGPSGWHVLLDGCLQACGASGAFALDPQGLVIATRGDLDPELVERLGARLTLTLDQARKMGESCRVVCVQVDGHWLTGLRADASGANALTLAVLSDEPLALAPRNTIDRLIEVVARYPA
jgi:hypothetical protein